MNGKNATGSVLCVRNRAVSGAVPVRQWHVICAYCEGEWSLSSTRACRKPARSGCSSTGELQSTVPCDHVWMFSTPMSDSTPLRVSIMWCGLCPCRWSSRATGAIMGSWYRTRCTASVSSRAFLSFKGAVFDVRGEGLCWYAMRKLTKALV